MAATYVKQGLKIHNNLSQDCSAFQLRESNNHFGLLHVTLREVLQTKGRLQSTGCTNCMQLHATLNQNLKLNHLTRVMSHSW